MPVNQKHLNTYCSENPEIFKKIKTMNHNSLNESNEIDEKLYSRQLYVLGHSAMKKMAQSSILISGLNGLGVEIAKNIILAGVKSVYLHDNKSCSFDDLSTQFFLSENDIGKNRARCSERMLADLNNYVSVTSLEGTLNDDVIKRFSLVVLCDSFFEEQLQISQICRRFNVKFISSSTYGFVGQIFCDFGNNFIVNDINGEDPKACLIASITNEINSCVTTIDDNRHGFEDDEYVVFSEVQGMTELNDNKPRRVKTIGPYTFSIGDTSGFQTYRNGGIATTVKMPKNLDFKSLNQSISNPDFFITDFAKYDHSFQFHLAFHAINQFHNEHKRLPLAHNKEDAKLFLKICQESNGKFFPDININEQLLKLFSMQCSGSICPMQAVIGGTTAQEILKACSGKFHPIFQWMYFDSLESLSSDYKDLSEEDFQCLFEPRFLSQVRLIGNQLQEKIMKNNVFLVGAGAIGCEHLKNMALLGVSSSKSYTTYVTDMDVIEKSNLSRQFLYRNNDVQKLKSEVAANAVVKMNRNFNVVAHSNKVGSSTEDFYGDDFFENLSIIINALDNVEARTYMDRRCLFYGKPLLESGTLGTKGNSQVVLPGLTESYSASHDPPDKSIPVCTLKNFPHLIEHTLQWARDNFDGLFLQPFILVNRYMSDPKFMESLKRMAPMQQQESIDSLVKVIQSRPKNFVDCVAWARNIFQDFYHNNIKQLLYNFPPDQLTSSGLPFWSSPKRCPSFITFCIDDPLHVDFIAAVANIHALNYNLEVLTDREKLIEIVKNVVIPEFSIVKNLKIATNDNELQNITSSINVSILKEKYCSLPSVEETKKLFCNNLLQSIEFEKDDDENFHMDFIVACSNLRANNYFIKNADRHTSKLIAGKIVPAIATSTSVVSGLIFLEFLKVIDEKKPIESFKNSFFNLALPFYSFSEPIKPLKLKYNDHKFTEWDKFYVDGSINNREMTLEELLTLFRDKHKLEITILSCGVAMVFSFFMDTKKKQRRLSLPVSEAIYDVTQQPINKKKRYLVLEICCNDMNDQLTDTPYIRYEIPRK